MMDTLWWQTVGTGDFDLVLVHGWGLNAEVWQSLIPELSTHFRVHLVDLPGYGRSGDMPVMSLTEMAECLLARGPQQAIWLGWSLGGLVTSQIALSAPHRVKALISVASSPCFAAQGTWPGIQSNTLVNFQHMLRSDFHTTVERFLALQTLGSEQAGRDARRLKSAVLAQPVPRLEVLNRGLDLLKDVDLRQPLAQLVLPHWRIYGQLDGLVPRKIVPLLDSAWPLSTSHIFAKASHAPFISHPEQFNDLLVTIADTL